MSALGFTNENSVTSVFEVFSGFAGLPVKSEQPAARAIPLLVACGLGALVTGN